MLSVHDKTVSELLNLDRLTGIALDRGEGLSAEDRRVLLAERRIIRQELERRHAAAVYDESSPCDD